MFQSSKIPTVFQSLRDIVITGDNDLVITGLNKAASVFFGWTEDEVRGKNITYLVPSHPLDLPDVCVTLQARHKNASETPVIVQSTRDPQATIIAWTITPVTMSPIFDFSFQPTFAASIHQKLSLSDVNCKGRRVFIRVDFNVPIDKQGKVRDDNRIRATIPTLRRILADGGRVIIGSHLGRPKKPDPAKSLKHVVPCLEELLGIPVSFAPNALTAGPQVAKLRNGEVLLLENLRFHKGEDSKDVGARMQMASILAQYTDLYVCDAFGTAHRDTASMTGIPRIVGAGIAGYLIEREVTFLSKLMKAPQQPVIAIVGGAKVSDKIGLLGNLFNICQVVIIGGAMAFTFLEAEGRSMGKSRVERTSKGKGRELDLHTVAKELLQRARKKNVRVVLPTDFACAKEFKNESPLITETADIPDGYMGLDIGPKTIERCRRVIAEGRTCIWNGPVGVFEFSNFAAGSNAVAEAISSNKKMLSIVGGGETAACAKPYKDGITHISTGGGATLELLEGKPLPGLVSLTNRATSKY
jgi:phosphoglycerate kinase